MTSNRKRVLAYVTSNPGCCPSHIAKNAHLSSTNIGKHLALLLKANLVHKTPSLKLTGRRTVQYWPGTSHVTPAPDAFTPTTQQLNEPKQPQQPQQPSPAKINRKLVNAQHAAKARNQVLLVLQQATRALTRTDIVAATSLDPVTVSNYLGYLRKQRLVMATGTGCHAQWVVGAAPVKPLPLCPADLWKELHSIHLAWVGTPNNLNLNLRNHCD